MAEHFTIPTVGDVIVDKYRIEEELGRGSYGIVFRATQLGVNRSVAIKTLLPQAFLHEDIKERFQREASLVSLLQHPNIVTLFDFGQMDGGALYMAMEFVEGKPLSQIIEEETPLAPQRAVFLVKQVLRALAAAHAAGIVHRDLKPENILVTLPPSGTKEVVKVVDFGIAKLQSDEVDGADKLKALTMQGFVLGTPHYMSPENIIGDPVDERADLYAVGIFFFELLCGVHPYEAANPQAVLVRHLNDPLPRLPTPQLDRTLGHAIRYALVKDPDGRVPSARVFLDILDNKEKAPNLLGRSYMPFVLAAAAVLIIALTTVAVLLALPVGEPADPVTANEHDAAAATDEVAEDDGEDAGEEEELAGADADDLVAEEDAAAVAVEEKADSGAGSEEMVFDPGEVPSTSPKKPRPRPKTATKTPPAATGFSVSLSSVPPGARVSAGGRPLCTTPCTATLKQASTLRFEKIGYSSASRKVKTAGSVSVKLRPARIRLSP